MLLTESLKNSFKTRYSFLRKPAKKEHARQKKKNTSNCHKTHLRPFERLRRFGLLVLIPHDPCSDRDILQLPLVDGLLVLLGLAEIRHRLERQRQQQQIGIPVPATRRDNTWHCGGPSPQEPSNQNGKATRQQTETPIVQVAA